MDSRETTPITDGDIQMSTGITNASGIYGKGEFNERVAVFGDSRY